MRYKLLVVGDWYDRRYHITWSVQLHLTRVLHAPTRLLRRGRPRSSSQCFDLPRLLVVGVLVACSEQCMWCTDSPVAENARRVILVLAYGCYHLGISILVLAYGTCQLVIFICLWLLSLAGLLAISCEGELEGLPRLAGFLPMNLINQKITKVSRDLAEAMDAFKSSHPPGNALCILHSLLSWKGNISHPFRIISLSSCRALHPPLPIPFGRQYKTPLSNRHLLQVPHFASSTPCPPTMAMRDSLDPEICTHDD